MAENFAKACVYTSDGKADPILLAVLLCVFASCIAFVVLACLQKLTVGSFADFGGGNAALIVARAGHNKFMGGQGDSGS